MNKRERDREEVSALKLLLLLLLLLLLDNETTFFEKREEMFKKFLTVKQNFEKILKFPLILCPHLYSKLFKKKKSSEWFISHSFIVHVFHQKKEHSKEGISERLAHFFLQTSSNTMTQSLAQLGERERSIAKLWTRNLLFFCVTRKSRECKKKCNMQWNGKLVLLCLRNGDTISHYIRHKYHLDRAGNNCMELKEIYTLETMWTVKCDIARHSL